MNPKKNSSVGQKTLSASLMASILFIHVFLAPGVAHAQSSIPLPTNPNGSNGSVGNDNASLFPEGTGDAQAASYTGGQFGPVDGTGSTFQTVDGSGAAYTSVGKVVLPSGYTATGLGVGTPFQSSANTSLSGGNLTGTGQAGSGQAAASQSGTAASQAAAGSVGSTAAGTLQCSAAGVLGNVLTSSIRSAITSLVGGTVRSAVSSVISQTVPVDVKGAVAEHTVGDIQPRSGSFTFGSIFKGVSWDSIAWCIVNSMIEQIANSTIAWANSGFNGNPAFIQNPERFFSDLADQTAGSIIKDIAYGGAGINVCQPFRVNIAIGLAQTYQAQNTPLRGMSCRLSDITQQRFFGGITTSVGGSKVSTKDRPGNITLGDWIEVTQNDSSNPYGSQIMANQILYAGITKKQNTVQFEVGMNNGWLNFKKCKDPKNPKSCDIVTPGRLIESQLNSTLDQSKNRLVMAQKFDQMVTAIVNNLIKVALNKVLTR